METAPEIEVQAIDFEYWDYENGFFVEFRIPFTRENLRAVLMMGPSRNIRLVVVG